MVFVRSGDIELSYTVGTLRDASAYGIYWSSQAATYTSSTSAVAYYLQITPSDVNRSYNPDRRFLGFPLRCLSTVLDM